MNREDVAHCLSEIVVDTPTQSDGPDDRAEIVVQQHDGGRLASDIRAAAAHGDPDMGGLERGSVIHAIAGHCDDITVRLECVHDTELLLRHDPSEHAYVLHPFCQFGIADG